MDDSPTNTDCLDTKPPRTSDVCRVIKHTYHAPECLPQTKMPYALCLCPLWLSFPELNQPFQTGCSTKCAMLMRSVAARHLHRVVSVGASDSPGSIWNPSCTRHPLESTSGPAISGKPLRHRTLQLSNSWTENPTLRRDARLRLRPGQGARPSSERLEIPCAHPIAASIWSNRRNRGTV